MRRQKLMEAVADIAYFAGVENYYSGDSRADVLNFIHWAKEFEKENVRTDWTDIDYMLQIEEFTKTKLNNHQ